MGCICSLQQYSERLESLDSFEKASFVLGSERWEDDFGSVLDLLRIT